MKKLSIAIGTGLLLTAGAALAGYKSGGGITINTVSRYAAGSLGGARNSANAVEYFDFVHQGNLGGAENLIIFARDANGVMAVCQSQDATILHAAESVVSDSYIYFSWDVNGRCTALEVRAGSYHPPKVL